MNRAILVHLLTIALSIFALLPSLAETAKMPSKATELLVWRYETLIMEGALLSPEGWNRASALFQHSVLYPDNSPIKIIWTPRFIGEDWVKDSRAQVESKWIDYYGTIDGKLRYQSPEFQCAIANAYGLTLTNTRTEVDANGTAREVKGRLEWRLVWPNERAASIEQVILYLKQRRERTHDQEMKRNATASIASLQRLLRDIKRGRGANAC